jgi:hypothetical protein
VGEGVWRGFEQVCTPQSNGLEHSMSESARTRTREQGLPFAGVLAGKTAGPPLLVLLRGGHDGLMHIALSATQLALHLPAEAARGDLDLARLTRAGVTHIRARVVPARELALAHLAAAEHEHVAAAEREMRAAARADMRAAVARHARRDRARRAQAGVAGQRARVPARARAHTRDRARVRRREPPRLQVGTAPQKQA